MTVLGMLMVLVWFAALAVNVLTYDGEDMTIDWIIEADPRPGY